MPNLYIDADYHRYYFFIFQSDDRHKREDAEPFMINGRPHLFAEIIFENAYYLSLDKEKFVEDVEAGRLYFSLIDCVDNDIDVDFASPLLEFSAEESEKIRTECKKILASQHRKNFFRLLILLMIEIKNHPAPFITFLILGWLVGFSAQKPSQSQKNTNKNKEIENNYHLITGAFPEVETPIFHEPHLVFMNKNSKQKPSHLLSSAEFIVRENFLLVAIINDNLNNFKHILSQGYDLFKKNNDGKLTFLQAAEYNSHRIIHYVVHTLKINLNRFQPDENHIFDSMLIKAIDNRHDKLARKLVKWGFNIDHTFGPEKKTLLHILAALPNANILGIKKLLDLRADINAQTTTELTPIFIAGMYNNIPAMKIFLEHNCHTVLNTSVTKNLLSFCIIKSNFETIEFLLQQGFDPYLHLQHDIIPMVAAVTRGDTRLMDLILKYNYKLNQYPTFSLHLLLAAWHEKINLEIAYYLVKRGVNVTYFAEHVEATKEFISPDTYQMIQIFLKKIDEWIIEKKYYKENKNEIIAAARKEKRKIKTMEIPEFITFINKYRGTKSEQDRNEYRNKKFYGFLSLLAESMLLAGLATMAILSIADPILRPLYRYFLDKILKQPDDQKNEPLEIILIKEKPIAKEIKLIKPKPVETTKPTPVNEIKELIAQFEYEKHLLITEEDGISFSKTANTSLTTYEVVPLEDHYRSQQHQLNNQIHLLHKTCAILMQDLNNKKSYLGKTGQDCLSTCIQELNANLNNTSYDYAIHQKHIECFQTTRIDVRQSIKEIEILINEIKTLQRAIEKEKKQANLIKKPLALKPKKIKIEIKPTIERPIKNTSAKQNIVITTKSTHKPNIKKTIANNSHFSLFAYDSPDEIKNDNRVIYANELMQLIENLIHNNNVEEDYKQDAAIYLLIKTSHAIAQITSRYKTIIMPFRERLYHIRNNFIHYPSHCLNEVNIPSFLSEYFILFDNPIKQLAKNGSSDIISTDNLYSLSPFILSNQRDNFSANLDNDSLTLCFSTLHFLLKKATIYYDIGFKLKLDSKYMHAGLLHAAMHTIILHLRENLKTLKKLNKSLFINIHTVIPDIIFLGDKIAHHFSDELPTFQVLEGRHYYAQEDIPAESLLEVMGKLRDNLFTVSSIMDDYLNDNKEIIKIKCQAI